MANTKQQLNALAQTRTEKDDDDHNAGLINGKLLGSLSEISRELEKLPGVAEDV